MAFFVFKLLLFLFTFRQTACFVLVFIYVRVYEYAGSDFFFFEGRAFTAMTLPSLPAFLDYHCTT